MLALLYLAFTSNHTFLDVFLPSSIHDELALNRTLCKSLPRNSHRKLCLGCRTVHEHHGEGQSTQKKKAQSEFIRLESNGSMHEWWK